jgi:hypothetical protein
MVQTKSPFLRRSRQPGLILVAIALIAVAAVVFSILAGGAEPLLTLALPIVAIALLAIVVVRAIVKR